MKDFDKITGLCDLEELSEESEELTEVKGGVVKILEFTTPTGGCELAR